MAKKKKPRRLGRGARSSIARDTRNKLKRGQGALVNARGTFSILRDKGILFNALTVGAVGNEVGSVANGISYGFARTPHSGDGITIGELAAAHHFGVPKKHLPARPILVAPDKPTADRIRGVMQAAAARAIRESFKR